DIVKEMTTTASFGETSWRNCGFTSKSSIVGSTSTIDSQASWNASNEFSNICFINLVSISVKFSTLFTLSPLPPSNLSSIASDMFGLTSMRMRPTKGAASKTYIIVIEGTERINSSYGSCSTEATAISTYLLS